jgi:hypothetical protein
MVGRSLFKYTLILETASPYIARTRARSSHAEMTCEARGLFAANSRCHSCRRLRRLPVRSLGDFGFGAPIMCHHVPVPHHVPRAITRMAMSCVFLLLGARLICGATVALGSADFRRSHSVNSVSVRPSSSPHHVPRAPSCAPRHHSCDDVMCLFVVGRAADLRCHSCPRLRRLPVRSLGEFGFGAPIMCPAPSLVWRCHVSFCCWARG